VRYGRTPEDGFLPVHSVWTEEQARELLVLCCGTDPAGNFIARELAHHQTLDNLSAFGKRLYDMDQRTGISAEKPEGVEEVSLSGGASPCAWCKEETAEICEECAEPLCSGFLCQYSIHGMTVCAICFETLDKED